MDLGGLTAGIGLAVLVYIGITVALMALGLWIAYTVIWRAVRRGLREFHGHAGNVQPALYPPAWSTAPKHVEERSRKIPPTPIRSESGPRDW